MLFEFVTGHGARTYVNECKNEDKLIVWSMLVFLMSREVLCMIIAYTRIYFPLLILFLCCLIFNIFLFILF